MSATAVTGNVRAVGLPTPPPVMNGALCGGKTSVLFSEKSKLTKGSFTQQQMGKGM